MTVRYVSPQRMVLSRAALVGVLILLTPACSSGSPVDTAARDRCEAKWGVGNCVERNANWVPLASATSTTTAATSPTPTSPTTAADTTAPAITAPPERRVLRASEVLGVPFGTPESEALSRLTKILGSPSEPTATNLGGGVGNYRTFGSLTVLFFEATLGAGDRTLSGWLVDSPDGTWTTDAGIAPGSSEAAVLSAYPAATVTNEDECDNAPYILSDQIEFSLDESSRTVDGIGSPSYGFC